jgi:predicted nucleic acid-binding protein
MTYALDTSTIIRLLRNDKLVCAERDKALEQGAGLVIPIIADYEIWRGFYYKQFPAKEQLYELLCLQYPVIDLSRDSWNQAAKLHADLRRSNYTIGDADILIASLCIVGGYTLVSTNIKHYEIIDKLQLVNWAE